MAHINDKSILTALTSVLSPKVIEETLRAHGAIKRERKITALGLVSSLVLGFPAGRRRFIESLRRTYCALTGTWVERSSYYDRLTPELASALRALFYRAVASTVGSAKPAEGPFADFDEVVAMDATVIRLNSSLRDRWKGTRTNHSPAALKAHTVINVHDGRIHELKLTPETVNDREPWQSIGDWVRGKLLLFDLGYYSFNLFERIDDHGGMFVSRAKKNSNFEIIADNRPDLTDGVPVDGRRLKEVLADLKGNGRMLDTMVRVVVRQPGGTNKSTRRYATMRCVASWNEDSGGWHCYLTNCSPERLPAQHMARAYALRWQIELFFRAMKSVGRVDQISTSKSHIVECLIWVSALAAVVSSRLHAVVREAVGGQRFLPLLRWHTVFGEVALSLADGLINGTRPPLQRALRMLGLAAPDPNRNRRSRAVNVPLVPIGA